MKPAPCPYRGHPAKVYHLLARDPRFGSYPLIGCTACGRVQLCACDFPDAADITPGDAWRGSSWDAGPW